MKKLILIAVMCFFSGLVISEEIVMNKDGKAVLLKDDNTWELIDTSKEQGKVVFSIVETEDAFIANREHKDNMEVVDGYDQYFGCRYLLRFENNTSYRAKIGVIGIGTTLMIGDAPAEYDPTKQVSGWGGTPDWNWRGEIGVGRKKGEKYQMAYMGDKVVKSGESGQYWVKLILSVERSKDPISDDTTKEYIKTFGCRAQEGTVYLRKKSGVEFIIFSEESGIFDDEIGKFIVGNPNGVVPLREDIFWLDQFGNQNR